MAVVALDPGVISQSAQRFGFPGAVATGSRPDQPALQRCLGRRVVTQSPTCAADADQRGVDGRAVTLTGRLAQGQRPLQRRLRHEVRAGLHRLVPRPLQQRRRPQPLPGLDVVFGDEGQVFAQPLAGVGFQPAGGPAVVGGPPIEQHRLISHIAQQDMLEDVLVRPGEG